MPHPELLDEQRHLEQATHALGAMAARTASALGGVDAATEADAEVAAFHLRRRLESLAERDDVLAFGRIDEGAERWYVGRRHVEDADGTPLVVDWRAPVSVPFYRATAHDPLGLDRRRRFLAEGRALVDVLEEDFTDPDRALLSGGIPDPLLAELERERAGTMRDIVATIAELTVGYRTPAPILDLANRLLAAAAPTVTPARSIRPTGEAPRLVQVAGDALATATAEAVREVAGERGTFAVVATADHHGTIGRALDAAGVVWSPGLGGSGAASVLTPLLAKGLEFDVVVVVEPAQIVEAEPAGERALFVALTRPTRRLVVVHAEPLPSALR